MSNESRLREILAALTTTGAVVLAGCGGAPSAVQGTEVPAAVPSGTPSAAPVADAPAMSAAPSAMPAAPSAMPAAPSAAAAASAAPAAPMPKAASMPKGNHTVKVQDSKRTKGCEGGCGEGTCGTPCK